MSSDLSLLASRLSKRLPLLSLLIAPTTSHSVLQWTLSLSLSAYAVTASDVLAVTDALATTTLGSILDVTVRGPSQHTHAAHTARLHYRPPPCAKLLRLALLLSLPDLVAGRSSSPTPISLASRPQT